MKKRIGSFKMLLFLGLLALSIAPAQAQPRPSKEEQDALFKTISDLDTRLFDAYNTCDLETMGSLVTEDLEFYHDQTGLSVGRQAMVDAVRQNICGKVRRELVPGSLEVYPLKQYGAVEIGSHRFCDSRKHKTCGEDSGDAKFIMLWQQKDGAWKITRIISYDHVSH